MNDGTSIDVSSSGGVGGTAVVWSGERTTFLGSIDARGGAGGGSVHLSSAGELRHGSLGRIEVGDGHLLIDPGSQTAGGPDDGQGWAYAGAVGVATSLKPAAPADGTTQGTAGAGTGAGGADDEGVEYVDFASQEGERFGGSVAINGDATRLAVGQPDSAVYLFAFSDTAFSGGTLVATVGEGQTGGKERRGSGTGFPPRIRRLGCVERGR